MRRSRGNFGVVSVPVVDRLQPGKWHNNFFSGAGKSATSSLTATKMLGLFTVTVKRCVTD